MILQKNPRNDHMVTSMVMAPVYCVVTCHDWSSSEHMLCSYSSLAHSDLCFTVRMLCKVPHAL